MRLFVQRNLDEIVLGVLVATQILLLGQQVRTPGGERHLSYWSGYAVFPLRAAAEAAARFSTDAWDRYGSLRQAQAEARVADSEADRLRVENAILRQRLLRLEDRRHLEAYMDHFRGGTLTAGVVAASSSRFVREVYLDRGQRHGVSPGMAVVSPEGIVGKVEVAYGQSSMVRLITDPKAAVGVFLVDSGLPAVLRGAAGSICRLDHLRGDLSVSPGDLLHTSGMDGVFPAGLRAGRVLVGGSGPEAEVEPVVRLDRLTNVLVLQEGTHAILPSTVQRRIAGLQHGEAGQALGVSGQPGPVALDADRIKWAYREQVESQGQRVGALNSGGGLPELSRVVRRREVGGHSGARADAPEP